MTSSTAAWQRDRERLMRRIDDLKRRGICYLCHDLRTGEVFGDQPVIHADAAFKVVLDPYPRMLGHTIVIYKPHRDDVSLLSDEEAGRVFAMCPRIVRAIKAALGAEKVYLASMCDGEVNHLHVQLLPRYVGDAIGSCRFVAERSPLTNGAEVSAAIRAALLASEETPSAWPAGDRG